METEFQKELCDLINRHSKESESNTPDFILAQFLVNCLDAFNMAVSARPPLVTHPLDENPAK